MIVTAISFLYCQNSARALTFNFSYAPNTTYKQKVAFELAGKIWSQYLTDNPTINIHVQMTESTDLPAKVIGGAMPVILTDRGYESFHSQLFIDATSVDDLTAYKSLEPWYWTSGITAYVGNNSSDKLSLTRANAKALKSIDPNSNLIDALIVMSDLSNTGIGWQYNYLSSNFGTNNLDFTSVIIHEIGHTLGFTSGVDIINLNNWHNNTIQIQSTTAFDLFRYSSDSGKIARSTTHGYDNYFSIDGGKSALGYFATGKNTVAPETNITWGSSGDGYQGSHWANADNIGLMDPVLEKNTRRSIGALDLKALDVIGWNKKSTTFSSLSSTTLQTLMLESQVTALLKTNINRNLEIDTILREWTWGKGGSTGTLGQTTNLAQFLSQQGFFNIGSLWETLEDTSFVPIPESRDFLNSLGLFLLAFGFQLRQLRKNKS
jgi:hypothetical protein